MNEVSLRQTYSNLIFLTQRVIAIDSFVMPSLFLPLVATYALFIEGLGETFAHQFELSHRLHANGSEGVRVAWVPKSAPADGQSCWHEVHNACPYFEPIEDVPPWLPISFYYGRNQVSDGYSLPSRPDHGDVPYSIYVALMCDRARPTLHVFHVKSGVLTSETGHMVGDRLPLRRRGPTPQPILEFIQEAKRQFPNETPRS